VSTSVPETVAIVLSNHYEMTDTAACVCGWDTSEGRVTGGGYLSGAYEHMATVLSEYGLLAPEER